MNTMITRARFKQHVDSSLKKAHRAFNQSEELGQGSSPSNHNTVKEKPIRSDPQIVKITDVTFTYNLPISEVCDW